MSVYRAHRYGIESLRIQSDSSSVTKGDSEVFMIKVQPTPETINGQSVYLPERAEAFSLIKGTTALDTAYNLDITPKRNLYRHGNYLHAILDKYDDYSIKFTSALRSASIVTVGANGKYVAERDNIDPAVLGPKLFIPYIVTITCKLPVTILDTMDAMPTGYVKFSKDGNSYTGFVSDAGIDISKNTEQTFKLLLCKSNNLSTLKR